MEARPPDRHLEGVTSSHRDLLAMLDGLLAAGRLDPAVSSTLPGWTVGHVLTHLAGNADSISRVAAAAERGEVVDRYEGGGTGRNAEIDAGSARRAAEQVDDVRTTIARLELVWSSQTRWGGLSREMDGRRIPVADLVFARWREVEVHRADLGLGCGPADWPAAYVREELVTQEMRWNARRPMGMTGLPDQARRASPHVRLAWLLGRTTIEGLQPPVPF